MINHERINWKNANEYWKFLKSSYEKRLSKKLNTKDFADYFRAINDPESVFFQPDDDVIEFNENYLNEEIKKMFSELDVNITESETEKAVNELEEL